MKPILVTLALGLLGFTIVTALTGSAQAQAWGLPAMSKETEACLECHRRDTAGVYQQWGASKHFRANVGCFECHMAAEGDPDAFLHEGQRIATIVSPKDCARCHSQEAAEFASSHHSKGARILGSLDNTLAEVVEGNRGLKTPMFTNGVSAAAVNGCWQCHGGEVRLLATGKPDPAIWPNTGIGRINPDGSRGSCSACHSRHAFSASVARQPENCGKCHLGPDHPQMDLYESNTASPSRLQGQAQPGFLEMGRWRGLQPRAHLRHLPHERHPRAPRHQGPRRHPRHARHARRRPPHQLEQPPRNLHPA
jgi:nitrate/TMAO reductase-like tetraheme cytochrome c subunit